MRHIQLYTVILVTAVTVCFSTPAIAQIANPVKWSFTSKKIGAGTYELHITATIDAGWHLFAQEAGEGPTPTTFKFAKNPLVTPTGKVKESGKLQKKFDKSFDAELKYYEDKVDFIQKVTVKGKTATTVKGSVEFMTVDSRQALPPKQIEFAITLGGS